MQRKSRIRAILAVGIGLALLIGVHTAYADLLFDRGLPTQNLNNISNPNRSNWGFYSGVYGQPNPPTYYIYGDDFMISGPGAYHIDTGRVWVNYHSNPDSITGLSLWGGEEVGPMQLVSTSFAATKVHYANGEDYESAVFPGVYYDIWQIDFAVNRDVAGGQKYRFFVDGPFEPYASGYASLGLHASIAALSGSAQEGADTFFLRLAMENGVPGAIITIGDFSTDINVQLYGSPVPVPSALMLLGSGLLTLAGIGRRLRKVD